MVGLNLLALKHNEIFLFTGIPVKINKKRIVSFAGFPDWDKAKNQPIMIGDVISYHDDYNKKIRKGTVVDEDLQKYQVRYGKNAYECQWVYKTQLVKKHD